jgi:hypothetical protein
MRTLRVAGRVALGVWAWIVLVSLATPVSDPGEPMAAEPRVALRPVMSEPEPQSETPAPESPPEREAPAPEPAPEPKPVAAPEAVAPQVLSASDVRRGDAWLSSGGSFPVISASYDGLQSFRRYAEAMTSIGARFVVVSRQRIVGEVDLASGTLRPPALDRPFSPRARDYTGEPALAGPARRVRDRYGRDAVIMLLVPRALDAGLFGAIARELSNRGEGPEAFRQVEGRYERSAAGGLQLRLEAAERLDGSRLALSSVFDLSRFAGGPG